LVDIIIIKTSDAIFDPRVFKIFKSLSKKYSVLVLGWNREGVTRNIINKSILDVELLNFKAPFGRRPSLISYFYMLIYYTLFWTWILFKLIIYRPLVVHAYDVDTILPCLFYKLIFRKKVVFDASVRYAMAYIPTKSKTLYSIVNWLEELLCTRADVLVNGWEKELKTFRRRPKDCVTIMNCPEDYASNGTNSEHRDANVNLRLVYTGGIRSGRSLENIAAAIKCLKDIELVMAGQVVDKNLFNQILRIPNLKYKGFMDPRKALNLEASSDVMIALYDLNVPWNSTTTPNKLFEAMMCGIPIITNASADIVKELDCGIIVSYNDVDEIRTAILTLRDNTALRRKLGLNGRKAFLEKFNWLKMEEELFKLYERLLRK
jgi:glycosyltransferase involved in cell wall biosynthesis